MNKKYNVNKSNILYVMGIIVIAIGGFCIGYFITMFDYKTKEIEKTTFKSYKNIFIGNKGKSDTLSEIESVPINLDQAYKIVKEAVRIDHGYKGTKESGSIIYLDKEALKTIESFYDDGFYAFAYIDPAGKCDINHLYFIGKQHGRIFETLKYGGVDLWGAYKKQHKITIKLNSQTPTIFSYQQYLRDKKL